VLKIRVEGGQGCGGFSYKFEVGTATPGDTLWMPVHGEEGLFVDKDSAPFVEGVVVDYEETMAREGFVVKENPNAEQSCSCKMSFSPKDSLFE